ncbi:hypothetical protein GCM10010520_55740 [Rhizobium viscosum]
MQADDRARERIVIVQKSRPNLQDVPLQRGLVDMQLAKAHQDILVIAIVPSMRRSDDGSNQGSDKKQKDNKIFSRRVRAHVRQIFR